MSWSRRHAALLALGLAAGCGFRPVYGDRGADTAVRDELAAIALPGARSSLEFELRRALAAELDPSGRGAARRYRLDWRLASDVEDLAIQLDAVVTRRDFTLAAAYALVDLADGRALDRGRVQRTASFNITDDPFNDLVAREDAEQRAAAAVAIALRQRMVAHFERRAA